MPKCSVCNGRGWSVIKGFLFRIEKCERCKGTGKFVNILLEGKEKDEWVRKTFKPKRNIKEKIYNTFRFLLWKLEEYRLDIINLWKDK